MCPYFYKRGESMDRIIEVKGNGGYLSVDRRKAGNQHEANSTKLRITFDPGWDGYAKTVTFWDAKGQNPVKRALTADLLENVDENTRVYLCPIPGEALAENGMMTFAIDGYVNGVRQRTVGAELEVEWSPYEENAGEAADPTPSQAEQLQVQIERLLGDVHDRAVRAETAAEAADQARIAAERARDASLEIAGGEHVTMKDLEGKADVNHTHTLASLGAVAWNNYVLEAGDLLTWAAAQTEPTTIAVAPSTANTPYPDYWTVDLKISAEGAWRRLIARLSSVSRMDIRERYLINGAWGAWEQIATTNYAVNKAGDTMTGALGISIGGGHANLVADPACAYLQAFNDGTWDKRRTLLLRTKESAPDLTNVLAVATAGDETTGEYPVIHTGNLHLITPAAIGAARIETGTYVGTGKAGSLYPNSLTFRFEPTVVMLGGYGVPNGVVFFKGMTETSVYANTFSQGIKFALSGTTLTWYNSSAGESESNTTRQMGQLNMLGETYTYVALG